MATIKHRADASGQIDAYISTLPGWSALICNKLRNTILAVSSEIIEDWKWGPNYYCRGMLCGFGAFKQHVSLTFFQGALLQDEMKILKKNPGNLHNRHVKYYAVGDIDVKVLKMYLREGIRNNSSGRKLLTTESKTVELLPEFLAAMKRARLLQRFEAYTYYKRKELSAWVGAAKREETRRKRIAEVLEQLREGGAIKDNYRKRN